MFSLSWTSKTINMHSDICRWPCCCICSQVQVKKCSCFAMPGGKDSLRISGEERKGSIFFAVDGGDIICHHRGISPTLALKHNHSYAIPRPPRKRLPISLPTQLPPVNRSHPSGYAKNHSRTFPQ